MKCSSQCESNLSNCIFLKISRLQQNFKPMTSAIPVQCSTNRAIKSWYVGSIFCVVQQVFFLIFYISLVVFLVIHNIQNLPFLTGWKNCKADDHTFKNREEHTLILSVDARVTTIFDFPDSLKAMRYRIYRVACFNLVTWFIIYNVVMYFRVGPICFVTGLLELWSFDEAVINRLTKEDILWQINQEVIIR